ncbi:MAG: type II toxin-antitoxin system HicB family antitoxin [Gammaproteobacteria bacterium]
MERQLTLEYWIDDNWYVGNLKEVPGVFSQGETLEELEQNIREAYSLLLAEKLAKQHPGSQTKDITVDLA